MKVWKVLNQLLEAQQQNQIVLQRILDRLDVTEALRQRSTSVNAVRDVSAAK